MQDNSTIAAIATAPGNGAIAIVRVSGKDAIRICESIFYPASKNKMLTEQKANTIHFGTIMSDDVIIDEVLLSIFKAPHSYTGEDSVEISCHGSVYIQQKILELLIDTGARLAKPGEFTQRAFLNGKLDLSQAEGVADLIASDSEASHKIAMQQMRGSFSAEINILRQKLLKFISLIELELDFSEEDVEFANRVELGKLLSEIAVIINELINSFKVGNVIKNGIPVAIVGNTNVGKSTLLNILLREERAIVSEIPGTTRDSIEDVINIGGITFRFIDTAGIRETKDKIEIIGIDRTKAKIEQASIVLLLVSANDSTQNIRESIKSIKASRSIKQLIVAVNKTDLKSEADIDNSAFANIEREKDELIYISAKSHFNIDKLIDTLLNKVNLSYLKHNDVVVSNIRHYEALQHSAEALERAEAGLQNNLPTDLLAMDIRQVLHYLAEITGEITTDETLGNIFKNFCIGK